MPEALERDLDEAIRTFAREGDVAEEHAIYRIKEAGAKRSSYMRGNFVLPPGCSNRISLAIDEHENGNDRPLEEIKAKLRAELGIEIDIVDKPFGSKNRKFVTEIVVIINRKVLAECGVAND